MKHSPPERPLEPPENYDNPPPFCEECEEEDCFLEIGHDCPAWDQAEASTKIEWEESQMDNDNPQFDEDYEDWLDESRMSDQEPSDEEKDFMRRMCIDFEEE